YNNSQGQPPLIQIERPGEEDGSVVAWGEDLEKLAEDVSIKLGLLLVSPDQIKKKLFSEDPCQIISGNICRKISGVSADENIFVNGIVIGKSKSSDVAIIAKNGTITDIMGGELKEHGVEKLGTVNLEKAILKTGLLRKSRVEPRIIKSEKSDNKFTVSYLNH